MANVPNYISQVDQPETVRGVAGDRPPPDPPVTLVVGDEDRQPVHGVEGDFVEGLRGVSVAEVARLVS